MKPQKLLVIITESILESPLTKDLQKFGVTGYTIIEARGVGLQGMRNADYEYNKNIQIEIVCDEDVANKIIKCCKEKYVNEFAMFIFTIDVNMVI
ncbi:MAG: transcriptional regulator [Ignavibacteria bacterium]|nr:transcriptional regulator [Ignavibacteria bacterium]